MDITRGIWRLKTGDELTLQDAPSGHWLVDLMDFGDVTFTDQRPKIISSEDLDLFAMHGEEIPEEFCDCVFEESDVCESNFCSGLD